MAKPGWGSGAVTWEMALRSWKKTASRPVNLTFSLVQPLVWMLFFGFLLQRYPLSELPPGVSYQSFLVPGICGMTLLFGSSQAGIALIRDYQTGFLERMVRTPARRWELFMGRMLADAVRLVLQAMIVLAMGVIVGAQLRFVPGPLVVATSLAALFAIGLSSLSSVIALRAKAPEAMAAYVHLVNMPLVFTSTVLVPAKQMPEWLMRAAQWNPLSLLVNFAREVLLIGGLPSAWPTLAVLSVVALAFSGLSVTELQRLGGRR